jgi:hypothetical protein
MGATGKKTRQNTWELWEQHKEHPAAKWNKKHFVLRNIIGNIFQWNRKVENMIGNSWGFHY